MTLTLCVSRIHAQCPGAINTFPYNQDFETDPGSWVSGGTNSDWTWGTPAKTTITGAGHGLKCWIVGGLTGSTYATQQSYIQSPCFDFTNLTNPYVQFLINWQTSQNDGGTFQYSIDSGATWLNAGAFGDPIDCYTNNWYNAEPITNDTLGGNYPTGVKPNGGNGDGWSGNTLATSGSCAGGGGSAGWVLAQHCLSILAGQKKVMFRFTFGSGSTCNNYDGIAIDNITIENGPSISPGFTYSCSTATTISFNDTTKCESNGRAWNFGDANSSSNTSTALKPTHTFSGPGVYTVKLTVTNCAGTFVSTQQVQVLSITMTATGSTCGTPTGSATATVAGGSGTYTYSWNTSPVQTGSNATQLDTGIYIVTVSAGSCNDTASVTVHNVNSASVSASAADTALCPSTSTTLTASGSNTYTWQPGGQTGATVSVSPSATTIYTVTGVIGTCINTATVTIHVSDTAKIRFPNIIGICQLYDSIDAGPGFSSYTWTEVGNATVIGNTREILVDSNGHYKVVVTKTGCSVAGTDTAAIYFLGAGIHLPLKDTTICQGQKVTLTANPSNTYAWSGPGGFNSSASSITVNPTVTTTYSLTSSAYTFNLVTDGDFEAPLDSTPIAPNGTGKQFVLPFTSQYYDTLGHNSLWPEGDYSVVSNPKWVHNNFSACPDHTTGTGKMMVINGATKAGVNIWGEHIRRIAPYTTYLFTAWATAETPSSPPVLQFAINGTPLGSTFPVSSTLCTWQKFTFIWTSGASTVADFSIVDQQTASSGNDFSIDDISFTALESCVDIRKIVVDSAPAIVVPNVTVCGDSAKLIANKGFSHYQWTPGTPADTFRTLTVKTAGTYQVLVSAGLCNEIGSATVLLNSYPKIVVIPFKDSVCLGSKVNLSDSGAGATGTYVWRPSNDTGTSVTLQPTQTTTYTVTGTTVDGCKDSTTVVVKVNPIPNIKATASPNSICVGFSSSLSVSGGNKYSWSPGSAATQTVSVSPTQSTTYTVTGIDTLTGCFSSDTTSIAVHTATGVTATAALDSICAGDSTTLTAQGGSSFTWAPTGQVGSTITVKPGTSTLYTVTGKNVFGCTATDTLRVGIYSIDKIHLFDTTVIKTNPTQIHTYTTGKQTYTWTGADIDYLSNPNIYAPLITATEAGTVTYNVYFNDQHGCRTHDSVTVFVISDCYNVFVPNAFSPNGDSKNDRLRALLTRPREQVTSFKVYNRWGEVMYSTSNNEEATTQGWDGTFNGQKQPQGTYVYYVKYTCNGTNSEAQGSVELIR